MSNWIKCDGVRVKNGKLQLKNPTTYYGKTRADKASFLQELFGTKTVRYKSDLKKGSRSPKVRATSGSLGSDAKDAIEALVGQGASKGQAKGAVQRALSKGAKGFDSIFKSALREI